MASLDTTCTIVLDPEAMALIRNISVKLDVIAAKLHEVPAPTVHNIELTANGRDLKGVLNLATDQLGRVAGK